MQCNKICLYLIVFVSIWKKRGSVWPHGGLRIFFMCSTNILNTNTHENEHKKLLHVNTIFLHGHIEYEHDEHKRVGNKKMLKLISITQTRWKQTY